MKIKVSELQGYPLDYIIANLEGHQSRCPWMLESEGLVQWQSYERAWGSPLPNYSNDNNFAIKLIDKLDMIVAKIAKRNLYHAEGRVFDTVTNHERWLLQKGITLALAVSRVYVMSELGDEVEVPDELIGEK